MSYEKEADELLSKNKEFIFKLIAKIEELEDENENLKDKNSELDEELYEIKSRFELD